jgi:cycloeucalenol cycloisomerase
MEANVMGIRFLAENRDKAKGEKFFLVYTPIWIGFVAVTTFTGFFGGNGDFGSILKSALVGLPLILYPLATGRCGEKGLGGSYWLKANLYIAILTFFGTYFGTEYFFDVLGMVYNYPSLKLSFDSALVGSGTQAVPISMYFMTLAYFMTYHSTASVALRAFETSRFGKYKFLYPLIVLAIGYAWAWLETFTMANPRNKEFFYYKDLGRMLTFGSLIYTSYFVVSFPVFHAIDEGEPWSLGKTAVAGLASSMGIFFLLDFWAKAIGRL